MPDVIDQMVTAINAQDVNGVVRCYQARATVVGPELQAEGHEQIRSYHLHMWEAFPGARMTIWEHVTEGDTVAIEGVYTGTHEGPFLSPWGEVITPTSRLISIRFCWMSTLEGGVIVSQRLYHDQMEIYSQLGIRLTTMR
ncbi:nuclear transport factor 2 family protein [Nonomuraea sp. B12E4]|uniref:nuclear transport factor 2 family protein n=1 Tax=Nonomuraea sp. B12E4 TaxID=3153564 RepID=UPI00325CC239